MSFEIVSFSFMPTLPYGFKPNKYLNNTISKDNNTMFYSWLVGYGKFKKTVDRKT